MVQKTHIISLLLMTAAFQGNVYIHNIIHPKNINNQGRPLPLLQFILVLT